ncbi:MAG: protein-glutamate O-methyltransferase CheR [Acidobacteria bacterium]|nr:MAG: protein-glutamate O-methyltransferase CheR [Acidobacteriota bacterium]
MSLYPEIEKILSESLGWDLEAIGRRNVERFVQSRLQGIPSTSYSTYVDRLLVDTAELARLVDALAVPETWFFRDKEAFACLGRSLRPRTTYFRVLSAPCSTGEEPVSIAITLLEAGLPVESFQIDAVDVSTAALSVARKGCYRQSAFRHKLTELQARYFERSHDGFRVASSVLRTMRFIEGNLANPETLQISDGYDVIFCKNLIIYLNDAARVKLVASLDRLLKPDGILFVGHSEVPLLQKHGYTPLAFARAFALTRAGRAVQRPTMEGSKPRRPRLVGPKAVPRPAPSAPPPTSHQVRQSEESLIDQAQRLADQGALDQAAEVCRRLIDGTAPDYRIYYLAGLVEQASNRLDAAEELFSKAIYLAPDHGESLVQMSLLLERKGDGRRAAQYRERFRRLEERERV